MSRRGRRRLCRNCGSATTLQSATEQKVASWCRQCAENIGKDSRGFRLDIFWRNLKTQSRSIHGTLRSVSASEMFTLSRSNKSTFTHFRLPPRNQEMPEIHGNPSPWRLRATAIARLVQQQLYDRYSVDLPVQESICTRCRLIAILSRHDVR